MAWDPSYAHMRRARLQGRRVNVHGRRNYIVSLVFVRQYMLQLMSAQFLQSFMWLNRFGVALALVIPEYKPTWDILDIQSGIAQSSFSRSIFLFELCLEVVVRLLFPTALNPC